MSGITVATDADLVTEAVARVRYRASVHRAAGRTDLARRLDAAADDMTGLDPGEIEMLSAVMDVTRA